MRTRGHLRGFAESVDKAKEDLYIPGELPAGVVLRSSEDGGTAPETVYSKPWTYPDRVTGFTETGLAPYKPWGTMRRKAKERTFSRLSLIPDELQTSHQTNPETYSMPQYPLYFLDGVPNFDEVPFGFGNYYHQDLGQGPETGDWGNLISSLSKGVSDIFDIQRKQYEVQAQAAQVARPIPKPVIPGTSNNFLLYAVIGGGVLLFLLKK